MQKKLLKNITKLNYEIKIKSGCLHNIIMPFKWSYPVIHAVPEILITIMDSPVPILLGLNLEKNSFIEKNYNNV